MKDKIISKATELFLKLGFKSVTMDDIANEMCISKKTIYKFFCNKEIHESINTIASKNYNAIQENFEIKKMFKELFKSGENSPAYQLKKHYPEIFNTVMSREINECNTLFRKNIEKGIQQGLYRENLDVDIYVSFYYTLIFSIHGMTSSEKESQKLELEALQYHTRAMATLSGIIELEKQLQNPIIS